MTGGLTPELPGLLRMVPASLGPSLPQLTFRDPPSEPSSTLKTKHEVLQVGMRSFRWAQGPLQADPGCPTSRSLCAPSLLLSPTQRPTHLAAAGQLLFSLQNPFLIFPRILRQASFHSITLVHLNQSISPSGISHLVILTCNTFLLSE